MQLPQIRLQQTYAQIGLNMVKPKQTLQQPRAELHLEQVPAKLSIQRIPSRLEIDQIQAWEEQGLKGPLALTRDMADRAYQDALEGIGRIAEEGDRLARIEHGGNPLADIARENANPPQADFNIAFIPSYGSVKVRFTPAKLDIQWELGGKRMNPEIKKPIHEYTPGKVEVYVRRKNSLTIDVVGLHMDRQV